MSASHTATSNNADRGSGLGLKTSPWRLVVSGVFVLLLLSPAFVNSDTVPLSRYPMYATPRSSTIEFVVAIGIDSVGNELLLDTRTIAATSDPLIAESWLRDAAAAGRLAQACREILGRVNSDVVIVELRREAHDVAKRAQGQESRISATSDATCGK